MKDDSYGSHRTLYKERFAPTGQWLAILSLFVGVSLAQDRSADYTDPHQRRAHGIYEELISLRTAAGHEQVPAAAEFLAGEMRGGGFAAEDVRVLPSTSDLGEQVATLVVRYRGRDSSLPAVLFLAHVDVVDALREDWERDPFTLIEEDGYFFARGSGDDKFGVAQLLASFLLLREQGYVPPRDLVLGIIGDEETEQNTTRALPAAVRGLGVAEIDFAINADGGGGVLDENFEPQAFLVQLAEKTYATFELTVRNPGGHSSTPRTDNAIYQLAAVLQRLEAYRFPVRVNDATRTYFEAVAPLRGGEVGDAMLRLAADPEDAEAADILWREPGEVGVTRTTCVATMLRAGHAENALPQSATATVNCRVFPGVEISEVERRLQDAIADPEVELQLQGSPNLGPATSPREDVLQAVAVAVEALHPGTPLVPYMAPYTTDGVILRAAGIPTYGLMGLFSREEDQFAHGLNERVRVRSFFEALEFWPLLMQRLAELGNSERPEDQQ